jgi:hypothetical protein
METIYYLLALWVKYASAINGVLLLIAIIYLIRLDKKLIKLRDYREQTSHLLRLIAQKLKIPEGDMHDRTDESSDFHLTDV